MNEEIEYPKQVFNKLEYQNYNSLKEIKRLINSNANKILRATEANSLRQLRASIFLNKSTAHKNYQSKNEFFLRFLKHENFQLEKLLGIKSFEINTEQNYKEENEEKQNFLDIEISFNEVKIPLGILFYKEIDN